MPPRARALWIAFLAVWAAALLVFGAVRPVPIAATAAAMAALYGLSMILLPDPPRLSKAGLWILGGMAAILLLQAAPLPFLYPYTTKLRTTLGTGTFLPGTADAFLSARFAAQATSYVLAALLVIRLRQNGLSTSTAVRGLLLVAGLEAAWGVIRALGQIDWIPFYDGPRQDAASATGTLVNRNNFAGFCAMGLVLASALATTRFTWPPRRGDESGRPALGRRIEAGLGWALLAALFAAAILLAKSRGAALAALAGLAVLPVLHRGRANLAGVGALVLAALAAVLAADPGRLMSRFGELDPFELSSDMRWRIWTSTTAAAWAQPLLGFGLGTHPNAFHPFQPPTMPGQVQHAHNEYVNLLFEAGLVGLAFALAALGVLLVRAWRGLRPLHSPDRLPAAGVVAAVVVALAHSLVDFDLRITGVGLFWAALVGLAAALSRGGEPAKATAWAATGAGLAAGALLAFAPLQSLALTPYDHAIVWKAGHRETAAALFPAHPGLQREAGLRFWEEGDAARAAVCLKRLFLQKPEDVESVLEEIYEPARDFEALLPGTSEAAARLAAFLARGGEWQKGMEVFERGVSKGPDAAGAHDYFAGELRKSGQWGLEARTRDRRLEAKSDAWAYGAAAEAWLRLGVYDRALERAVTAERIDPSTASWSALKAEILRSKGDGLGAVEAMTEALRKAPAELSYRLRRGELLLAERTPKAAIDDFKEVLRSRPAERRALLGLARALIASDQKESAKVLLDEWLGKNPSDAEAKALREAAR